MDFIFVIGGGVLQVPWIKAVAHLGFRSLVADGDPRCPGAKLADVFVPWDIYDSDNIVRRLHCWRDKPCIRGVVTGGTDASLTVAKIADFLMLPGISIEAAMNATDKFAMRKVFQAAGLATPRFALVYSVKEALEILDGWGCNKVVVKPRHSMGARGVSCVTQRKELESSFLRAESFAKKVGEGILMEEMIEGPELSIDALMIDNTLFIGGVADRMFDYAPFFVEIGHVLPSKFHVSDLKEAFGEIEAGAKALGIVPSGAIKTDLRLRQSDGKPFVLEMAARLSGGFMSTHTHTYATGVSLLPTTIALSVNPLHVQGIPEPCLSRIAMEQGIFTSASGRLSSVCGVREVSRMSGVLEVIMTKKNGDMVRIPENNVDRVGHAIVVGNIRDVVMEQALSIKESVRIHVD